MTRKNPVVSDPVKPYTFPNWLQMKPGDLIMGLAIYRHAAMPAERWYISDPNRLEIVQRLDARGEGYPLNVILERGVRWRVSLKDRREIIGANRVSFYKLTPEELKTSLEANPDHHMILKFTHNLPIGIFMGHVVRVDGITYVNILSSEGYDCWV